MIGDDEHHRLKMLRALGETKGAKDIFVNPKYINEDVAPCKISSSECGRILV